MEAIISVKILGILVCSGFLVGMINASIGVGGSLLAYPLLAYWVEGKTIIGVLSVIVIVATAHRLILYRPHFCPQAVKYFLILGVPSSIAGAYALAFMRVEVIEIIVGLFLISMTVSDPRTRRQGSADHKQAASMKVPGYFIGVGALSGFLTGLIGSAGFINTVMLLRAGFVKEGVSVNQAGIALVYSLSKLPVYWEHGIIDPTILLAGTVGSAGSLLGTLAGAALLKRMSVSRFVLLLRVIVIGAGVHLIITGFWS